MGIIVLFFVLFFVGCDANMNSFNINIEGTVDYANNTGNTNTSGNTNTNTGNNTNTGTDTNTGNNTNNGNGNGTNTNITDNIGAQLSTRDGLEVSAGTGIPVTGASGITLQEYKDYFIIKYSTTLTKVKSSNDVASITLEGIVNNDMARIPINSKFIKIYFNDQGGDSVSKIFEIAASNTPLPTN